MPNLETFVSKDPYRQCISFPNLNQSNSDEQELDCQQYLCGWIGNFRLFEEKPHMRGIELAPQWKSPQWACLVAFPTTCCLFDT
jgi:hypothetical protein